MNDGERWVTFDCFGTLVDWNGGFRGILEPIAGDQVDALIQAYHRLEREHEAAAPHCSYRQVLASSLAGAAAHCGIPLAAEDSSIIADSWEQIRPFEDVESALDALRGAGFRLGVLTNCDDDLFETTYRHFVNRFDLVVTAEDVMDYKPSLSHFRRFQRTTGVASGRWVHAACSWFHDIVPAAKLGLPSVWLDRDRTGHDPSFASVRITGASQLADAVHGLVSDQSA